MMLVKNNCFIACHEATVCNTWFEKKNIHGQTWQHSKSRQRSLTDFVVMLQKDRKYCLDVSVKRGADCNTDHHFVRARLELD